MTITPDLYEKTGSFYLGRGYDADAKAPLDELTLYKSKDLVTHGVVLGMTGSGKTGLCLALLEEAAMDKIPAIIIDPKGDIGNFLLTFPELRGGDFRPWINEDDAHRKNMEPDAFAEQQAETWRKGLADWGMAPDRIQKLRDTVAMRIYTPGSDSGIPLSILSSLNVPADRVLDDPELFSDRIVNTASSILGLLGETKDPQESREHAFLCEIFKHCWSERQNVDMQTLIRLILRPPFDKVGVFNADEFIPRAKRDDLAKSLNNLIASPNFKSWLEGCPLDIQSLMYTPDGKPSISILSISHLNDQERMFFVTLLLNELTAWMRIQSGTTSLRALFYMDEIFGYLPPVANPPSKKPMLLLLKQSRAFGLGLLLATQNPVDLDYKALSNIGTWFLGRLQTQRDKDRVLDGLEGAASEQSAGFDRKRMDALLSELGNRIFLMNNVHEGTPKLFQVRWAMSYLRGPLTRDQIAVLMKPVRGEVVDQMVKASTLTGTTTIIPRPVVPDGIEELFIPTTSRSRGKKYEPYILRSAAYVISAGDTRKQQEVMTLSPFDRKGDPDWAASTPLPCRPGDLSEMPEDEIGFEEVPRSLTKAMIREAKSDFEDEIYTSHGLTIRKTTHPKVKEESKPDESEADFRQRIQAKLDLIRQPEEKKLMDKHEEWIITKWTPAYEKAKANAKKRWLSGIMKIIKPLIGLIPLILSMLSGKGGKKGLTVTQMRDMARAGGGLAGVAGDAPSSRATPDELEKQRADREELLKKDLASLTEEYSAAKLPLEEERIQPYKKDIDVKQVALVWMVPS